MRHLLLIIALISGPLFASSASSIESYKLINKGWELDPYDMDRCSMKNTMVGDFIKYVNVRSREDTLAYLEVHWTEIVLLNPASVFPETKTDLIRIINDVYRSTDVEAPMHDLIFNSSGYVNQMMGECFIYDF